MRHWQVHVTYKIGGPRSQVLLGFIQKNEPTADQIEKAIKEQQGVDEITFLNYTIKTLS